MRTTLSLDPDVARLIEDEVHRLRKPFKEVVNEALRRGLAPGRRSARQTYRVSVHTAKLRAGFDKTGFNKLADELEDEAVLRKPRRRER